MLYRSISFWITLLTGALVAEGTALGHTPHLRPGHAPLRLPGHAAAPARHTPPLVGSGHRASPHTGFTKPFRSRGGMSVRKPGTRSRTSAARHSPTRTRGLRSLPRAAYPTDLRGTTEVDGRFLRPIDGDTFAMNGVKVRMSGLDAPELGTPGGMEAAQHLAALLQEGQVTIVPRSRDVYGRTVADVFMNGHNLADRMIAEGYARRG